MTHNTDADDRQAVIKLVELLAIAMVTGKDRQSCIAACDELVTFTMMKCQGPQNSRDENNRFVGHVNDLRDRFKSNSVIGTSEALHMLSEALKFHLAPAVSEELPDFRRGSSCPEQGERRLWQMQQRFRRRASDRS